MKKRLLFIGLLSCFSLSSFGQSWDLVPANDKLNFLEDGQDIIQNTIWIDSISINGSTMVYHLNRVATCDDPPTNCLRNQAGLLGKEIIVENGEHRFGAEANLIVIPNASLGTNWLYDSDDITAEVVAIEEANVWGIMDSVKTIALSNSDTILLSKQWGLLYYPTDASNYTTVGIDNLDLGETVPGFFDIFEFEVGDIFYHENSYNASSQGSGEIGTMSLYRSEILSKAVFPDRLEYTVHFLGYTYDWSSFPPTTSNFDEVQTISFDYSPEHPANYYHRDLFAYGDEEELGNGPFWTIMHSSRDEQGRYAKSIGVQETTAGLPDEGSGGFVIDLTTDTLQQADYPDQFHVTYKEGLGEILYINRFFEVGERRELIGYIKDGVEVGEIIPDADLVVSVDELVTPTAWVLYPNPTRDYIHIQFPTENQNTGQWEIRDLAGKLLLSGQYNGKEISIATLAAGVYLFTFTEGKNSYTRKVIKY
jgi:hypothetical protein